MKRFVLEAIEMPEQSKKALKRFSEEKIISFIADNFNVSYYDIHQIDDIAWVAEAETFYIKFQITTPSYFLTRFVEAKFDGKKLLPTDDTEIVDAKTGKKKFQQKHPNLDAKNFALCWQ